MKTTLSKSILARVPIWNDRNKSWANERLIFSAHSCHPELVEGSMKNYYVYIITNNTLVLYIGVTNNLERRIAEHKSSLIQGFARDYGLKYLVYYEQCSSVNDAIAREKQLKGWRREKKLNLIKTQNPGFLDLAMDVSTSST
jgi:putative endonuclease